MTPVAAIAQMRTTDLAGTIRFHAEILGLGLAFRYQDFYAGLEAGGQCIHLKQVDEPNPSIPHVAAGEHLHLCFETADARALVTAIEAKGMPLAKPLHETLWARREFAIRDDQGHTLYFGERI